MKSGVSMVMAPAAALTGLPSPGTYISPRCSCLKKKKNGDGNGEEVERRVHDVEKSHGE